MILFHLNLLYDVFEGPFRGNWQISLIYLKVINSGYDISLQEKHTAVRYCNYILDLTEKHLLSTGTTTMSLHYMLKEITSIHLK